MMSYEIHCYATRDNSALSIRISLYNPAHGNPSGRSRRP